MNEKHELVRVRRAKLEKLTEANRTPYPSVTGDVRAIGQVRHLFEKLVGQEVALAGRIMAIRRHGASTFATLRDGSGEIQIFLQSKNLGQSYDEFTELLDVGDIIWMEGKAFFTNRNEPTLDVLCFVVLSKSLRPLPEKHHGLKDTEARYRARYLDLLTNEESRKRFENRSKTVSAIRSFLDSRGFLEVETPVLQPVYGGALAKPFVTHHDRLDMDLYLRVSDELYLKRLIIGGLDRVYEIGHDFRNEGLDTSHNTEFTQMECYQAYADYTVMMELAEELVSTVAREVLGTTSITYQGQEISLDPPWRRLSVHEAVREHTGIDLARAETLETLVETLRDKGVSADHQPTWAKLVDELLKRYVRPKLIAPTFLIDYPVEMSPLAKRKEGSDGLVERFQPIVAGLELGNAYSELNDPIEQRARFEEQARARAAGDEETQLLDEDFLAALEQGMPPAGGLGIGVDRLVMLLTDTPSIRDVILFPQLRPENRNVDNSSEKA